MYVDFVTWNICLSWIWGAYHDALFYSLHVWLSFCLFYSWLCLCEWMCVCVFVCSFGCLPLNTQPKKSNILFFCEFVFAFSSLLLCRIRFAIRKHTHARTHTSLYTNKRTKCTCICHKNTQSSPIFNVRNIQHTYPCTHTNVPYFFLLSSFIHTIKCVEIGFYSKQKKNILLTNGVHIFHWVWFPQQLNIMKKGTTLSCTSTLWHRQSELSKRDIWTNARFTNGLQTARKIKNCLYRVFD